MNKVKKIRCQQGMTREQLAAGANVSPQFIYYIECNKKMPSLKTAKAIATCLGHPIDYVFFNCRSA